MRSAWYPVAVPTLSESASRELVAAAGVTVSKWTVADDLETAVAAAATIGYPVAVKLCGDTIAHKTERGLVRLSLNTDDEVRTAAAELLAAATKDDGPVELLVSAMLCGDRELIAGMARDPQFGACVMLGSGGVLAEALANVAFRLAPISRLDAHELIRDLHIEKILGPFRGQPAVDRESLVDTLCGLSDLASDPSIASVDLNPMIVVDGFPVAVDALVERTSPRDETDIT